MIKDWFKIASTMIGIKRNNNPKGEVIMVSDGREYYRQVMEEERLKVQSIRDQIQVEIESICRDYGQLDVTSHGFDSVSPILFETSLQAKVVKALEMDGYLCIMTFDYKDGKPASYLTVKWSDD